MRSTVAALAVFLTTSVAVAFDGDEHKALTNTALLVARKHVGENLTGPMAGAAKALTAEGKVDPERTLGDITAAADWFQDVTKLTKSDPFAVIRWRHRRYIQRGWALHRNDRHFQQGALLTYRMLHEQAVGLAAGGVTNEALYAEAVALHFLQDFFSAGHFVTPRKHSHDAVAGSLHDHFNRVGVNVRVQPDTAFLSDQWKKLLATFESLLPLSSGPLNFDAVGLRALSQAAPDGFCVGGDQSLPDSDAHRTLVLLLSAMSMSEVLGAPAQHVPPRIEVCFTERWAIRDPKASAIWARPVPSSFRAPVGAVRLASREVTPSQKRYSIDEMGRDVWGTVKDCEEEDLGRWLVRYDMKQEPTTMGLGTYAPSVLQVSASTTTDFQRRTINLGWILLATDPRESVVIRGEDEKKTDPVRYFFDPFRASVGFAQLSLIDGGDYHAVGGELGGSYEIPHTRFALSVQGGLRRYWHESAKWKIDYGGKLTYGVEVGNVSLGVDFGHDLDARGQWQRNRFLMPGFELNLSGSWLRKVFHRAPAKCCVPE